MSRIITQIVLGLWGIAPGNYSAITPVAEGIYAIVDDKDATDGYKMLTLEIDPRKGKVTHASLMEPQGMAQRRAEGVGTIRDCEGACYFADAGTIFVSGEANQDILEYDLEGNPTGRQLAIPASMDRKKISSNRGFEALTYNAVQHRFWTTTECTLPADRTSQPKDRLRLLSFDDSLQPSLSFIYQMDDPVRHEGKAEVVYGVSSMLALDDGKLLVLEREGYSPKWKLGTFVNHKIYLIDLTQAQPVPLDTPMAEVTDNMLVKKELLVEFRTRFDIFHRKLANYEGMCLGPKLEDGRQTLLLIADSQNGMGNALYHLKDYLGICIIDRDL